MCHIFIFRHWNSNKPTPLSHLCHTVPSASSCPHCAVSIHSPPHILSSAMNPLVWGPSFWFVMHTVSLNYPDNPTYAERRTHYDFYHIIRNILPCEMCREHYRELLEEYPIQPFLDSKTSLVSWVVMIHNQVNQRLGSPMIDRNEMLANYEQVYARGSFCDPACPVGTGKEGTQGASAGASSGEEAEYYKRVLLGVSITLGVLLVIAVLVLVVLVRRVVMM